jgi:hypothetical protein
MIDLAKTVEAKVDQLTADELLGGPRIILITKVTGNDGDDQPVSIHFEGDGGKPFKPCKTMRRVLMHMWGRDASQFAGRSLALYRDEAVKFGGLQVGGVRISHASHIEREMVIPVTVKQGRKAPVKIKPLRAEVVPVKAVDKSKPEPKAEPAQTAEYDFDNLTVMVAEAFILAEGAGGSEGLTTWWETMKPDRMKAGAADRARAIEIADLVKAKIAELKASEGEI